MGKANMKAIARKVRKGSTNMLNALLSHLIVFVGVCDVAEVLPVLLRAHHVAGEADLATVQAPHARELEVAGDWRRTINQLFFFWF